MLRDVYKIAATLERRKIRLDCAPLTFAFGLGMPDTIVVNVDPGTFRDEMAHEMTARSTGEFVDLITLRSACPRRATNRLYAQFRSPQTWDTTTDKPSII